MAAAKTKTTVVGVFEDHLQADKAVRDLMNAGFKQEQIGVAMRDSAGYAAGQAVDETDAGHAGSGAVTGALTGLGLGALAGMGVLAGVIPVIGPAIAAGTLGVIMTNAAAGAGIAGLVGALVGAGVPEHEAQYYHDEFEAGRTIVTVTAHGNADEATRILRNNGAYDMSTRSSTDVAEETSSRQKNVASTTTTRGAKSTTRESNAGADSMTLKEERLHAETRPVETGDVTVRKEVRTENKTLEVPVQREEVIIERTPVHGRAATSGVAASDLVEGEEIRIPVREEQVNVTKEAVVTEEVKVGKRAVQETKHCPDRFARKN